jgi:hypothetical protein
MSGETFTSGKPSPLPFWNGLPQINRAAFATSRYFVMLFKENTENPTNENPKSFTAKGNFLS